MCEYVDGCTVTDDQEAVLLWTSQARKRASWLVLCASPNRHPLAAIFDLPSRGEVFVFPGYSFLNRSMFLDDDGAPLDERSGKHHMHAGAIDLASYPADESHTARCRCGMWSFRPAQIKSRRFGVTKSGQPYSLGNYVSTADSEASRLARNYGKHGAISMQDSMEIADAEAARAERHTVRKAPADGGNDV